MGGMMNNGQFGNQLGGLYANSNDGLGGYAGMLGAGNLYNNSAQGLNYGSRGNSGYGGMNAQTFPSF